MKQAHTSLVSIGKQFREVTKEYNGTTYIWLAANEAAKKAIILVHGVTGNKLDMVVLGAEYVKRGYAVYAPDLPGHGSAPVLDARTFDDLGNWLRDCIAAINRQPFMIVGNSFASAMCYNYATQGYLAKETHLTLSCPTPDIAWTSRALRRASGILPNRLATKAYNSYLGIKIRVDYLAQSDEPSAKKWLNESEYHKIPFIEAKIGNHLSKLLATHNPYLAPMLPASVQKQITIVMGTKDNVTTRKTLPLLRRILPKARILIIPHVGHILHFEAPVQIAQQTLADQ